jgi:YVTN family beta-propeller protein
MQTRVRWVMMLVLVLLAIGMSAVVPAKKMGTTNLYVTNSLADDIAVIDLGTLKATGAIKVGKAVHGVCAPADGQKLFTTVEGEKNLKVIDTATSEVIATIALTGRPNQCASTPDGHYVGVPIRDGNSVDIVDITQNKVVKVLPVKVPHNCFNTGNNDDMYVSSMGAHEIDRINLKTMEYTEKIPVGGIPRPYVVSRDEKTMYVALTGFHGFAEVSIPDRKVIARVELPPAPPAACELEPDTPTHGLALSPSGKELWITSLADSGVYVYDLATKKMSAEISTGKCPNWISFSPDGKYSSVSNSASNDTSIIDAKTRKEVARVKVGNGPKRLLAVAVPAS